MARKAAEPYVKDIVLVLLKLLKESESDDLAVVLDKMIAYFPNELIPYATQLLTVLLEQFTSMCSRETSDEEDTSARDMAILGILTSVQCVVDLSEKEPKLLESFEAILIPVMSSVIQEGQLDFLDEILELMKSLTDHGVSNNMWILFGQLYEAFKRECVDYFVEMCPMLYNCISEGIKEGKQFPAEVPKMMFEMSKIVWERNEGEDDLWHAGKIMENLLVWCEGKVDGIAPSVIAMAIAKVLDPESMTDNLRIVSINMVLAGLRYNPLLFFQTIECIPNPATEPIMAQFFAVWFRMHNKFTGVHNRKTGIISLCSVLQLEYAKVPAYMQAVYPHLLPMILKLFEKLPVAYIMRAQYGGDIDPYDDDVSEVDSEYGDDDVAENEEPEDPEDEPQLGDNEDFKDDEEEEFDNAILESLKEQGFGEVVDENAFDRSELDEVDNDKFETPLDDDSVDEYVTFHHLIHTLLPQTNGDLANKLVSVLDAEQQQQLQTVFKTAMTRLQAVESKATSSTGFEFK